ncbi:MAG: heme exporter protein CcmD [Rhodobacteraceae bacterium]|nr:heme exporter protein CcmD [Paracoccaceae bacterium]MBR9822950.1 heme exporter protein CcmD [Paracoccaceae bacterium]
MPELGKYAATVLSSYGISILLLVALAVVSLRRATRVRRALEEVEARRRP